MPFLDLMILFFSIFCTWVMTLLCCFRFGLCSELVNTVNFLMIYIVKNCEQFLCLRECTWSIIKCMYNDVRGVKNFIKLLFWGYTGNSVVQILQIKNPHSPRYLLVFTKTISISQKVSWWTMKIVFYLFFRIYKNYFR